MTIVPSATQPATRGVFAAALIAGVSFWPASHVIGHGVLFDIWKAAGVALLALWAALRARDRWGWLIAAVMAWGAIGDVLLEIDRNIGAAAFLLGHVLAIILYCSRPRRGAAPLGLLLMAAILTTGWLLTHTPVVMIYVAGLAGMAGAALASRFPRRTVALGAASFAVSDLLIFAKMSVLAGSIVPTLLIWPLYFAGQALIAYGAVTFLSSERR